MRLIVIVFLAITLWLTGCSRSNQGPAREIYRVIWDQESYGFMNDKGAEIISPQYAYATAFSEGLAGVNVGGTFRKRKMPTDGKWGFINIQGEFEINPRYYSPPASAALYHPDSLALAAHEAYVFSEGLAAVRTPSEWVYINPKGEEVIRNPNILSARAFHEGLANVYINGNWGYINSLGQLVIYPQFRFPADFRQGFAMVVNQQGEKILIDKKGFRHLPQYKLLTQFHDGFGTARPSWKGEETDEIQRRKTLLVNIHGAPMTAEEFDWIGKYGSSLAPALVGSKIGNPISYPQALAVTDEEGGKWGFIDIKGEFKINPQFEDARGFQEGLAAVKAGGLWGYITPRENMITEFEFRWAGFFEDGLAAVRLGPIHGDYDGRYAYIADDGDVVWIEPPAAE